MAKSKKFTMQQIKDRAISVTIISDAFELCRPDCAFYAHNSVSQDHNCFHGNTKTECNAFLCPLKEES